MVSIAPMLWFDDNLKEAIDFYTSVFPDSKVHGLNRKPDGSLFFADFELNGFLVKGLNGGPHDQAQFNDGISFVVECDGQDEVDRYWDAFLAGGGQEVQCGWLNDPFGVRWQIVPKQFLEMMANGTPEQHERLMAVLMPMKKLDVAAFEAAYKG
jgi:predicted 3-demethylubiquinone-9 3-methyltransferase (glyoxalase superfamily)